MSARRDRSRGRRVWVRELKRIARRRPVLLGYHGVGHAKRSDDVFRLQVSPDQFRRQLNLPQEAGFAFVTVTEFVRRLGSGPPPPGLAAVSFDDGLRNNLTCAMPILRDLGLPATVYVATDLLGGYSPWIGPAGGGEMLNEPEVRDLAGAGWEIGAHTLTHADLAALDYEQCSAEITGSVKALERITGEAVETFAYPFGRYGPGAVAAVRDSGLLAGVTTGSGLWDPFQLTRAMVSAGDPLWLLLLKLTDRYEPLLRTPPLRLARSASQRARDHIRAR